MLTLRIRENLHIVGDTIISYETEVARIEGPNIVKLGGTWSRTTSKHITLVASLLSKPIIGSSRKKEIYDKLHYGARVRWSPVVSFDGSLRIIEARARGAGWIGACAAAWPKLSKRDQELVMEEYQSSWSEFERHCNLAQLGVLLQDESPDLSKINI